MKLPFRTRLSPKRPAGRGALRRVLRGAFYLKLCLLLLLGLAFGLLYLRLSAGPLSFGRLPERVSEALAARIGPGWDVELRNTAIELHEGVPALRANGLDIREPGGQLVVRAPYAIVSVDFLSLLTANLQPKSVEIRNLQLRVRVNENGSLSFSPDQAGEGGDAATTVAPAPPEVATIPPPDPEGPSQVSGVVGSLFNLVVGPKSILNSLGQAQLTNARLIVLDAQNRERARFQRVDATFNWGESGGRHFAATVEGAQGPWQLNGDATALDGSSYRASVMADGVPVQDILLLSGMSGLPAATDLELSGRFDVAFANGRVTELKTQLESNAGTIRIKDEDTSPLPVDHVGIAAYWNEAERALNLQNLELKGGVSHVRLQGRAVMPDEATPWRVTLNGKDAVWAGATPEDRPLQIGEIGVDLSGPDGVIINAIRLRGPDLSADVSGLLGTAADPGELRLDVSANRTDARSALRIWPEAVAPPVRRFLVSNLKAGMLDTIDLKVRMTGDNIRQAISGGPLPDDSLKIRFAISQGVLRAADGLPPVSRMDVTGAVTGRSASIRAPAGHVEMAGGYSLSASDGAFVLNDYWSDNALAQIGFRLTGGGQGLGALLQEPRIKEIAAFDVDPQTMSGKVDLRVGIGLAVNNIPAFADLPLSVNGTVGEFGIDKMFGKDRLEGANLAVAYNQGSLSIKGEGKLGGSPAAIDIQKARQGGGQASVSFSLDEAGRSKRGLSFGSQLTGTVAVKAIKPLGADAKSGITIEADLAKAGVNQLVPGWVKPVGKAGKVSFMLVEGATSEIRDLHLDSGVVQLRGTAVLSNEGSLEKAELSTFKLSPGDDMRAQIERSNGSYKVMLRGNVGDARPFLKNPTSSPAATTRNGAGQDAKDFDLDLNLNILTGFNEEAITNASIKASVRKDHIRQLDMKGRLGASNITARTVNSGGSGQVILLQAEDAGAVLRFTDVYRRLRGGNLILQMATGDGPQAGILLVNSFAVVNEPALRRIIPTQTQVVAGKDRAGNPQAVHIDINEVVFAKARVDFTRNAGRLDFKDAAIFGSQIGFTLGGFIDYQRDRLDIAGTFVPAFGLNNAFAQVPLFGPLLGGGQYEGLFAVNFRVAGQASAPTLSVNPLSAVAPGFLRKLFGVGGQVEAETTPAYPVR